MAEFVSKVLGFILASAPHLSEVTTATWRMITALPCRAWPTQAALAPQLDFLATAHQEPVAHPVKSMQMNVQQSHA